MGSANPPNRDEIELVPSRRCQLSSQNTVATGLPRRRCQAAKQHNEANMPFLFWIPMIVMTGFWRAAEDDTREFLTNSIRQQKRQTPA
jgi:hypothetical protein